MEVKDSRTIRGYNFSVSDLLEHSEDTEVWTQDICLPHTISINHLRENKSSIITSNRSPGEWGLIFGAPTATTAILDRLLHHSEVVTIRDDSYRLLEKRRAGLFNSKDSDKNIC